MSFGFWSRSFCCCLRQTRLSPATAPFFPFSSSSSCSLSTHALRTPVSKVWYVARVTRRSRLVWQAVRLELGNGNNAGAIDIVNAAVIADTGVRASKDLVTSVEFRGRVFSKLPSHSLVHGLIRAGMPFAAAEQVHTRMLEGTKIRAATMRAVVDALVLAQAGPSDAEARLLTTTSRFTIDNQRLELEYPKLLPGTRTAIQVLRCARRTHNDRTHQMYEKLIDACLLQGEIVVGCLLFALIVRDWQLRRILTPSPHPEGQSHGDPAIDGPPLTATQIVAAKKLGLHHWGILIPVPQRTMMQSLLSHIVFPGATTSATFKSNSDRLAPDRADVKSMKRAIFFLAELLDKRQLDMDMLVSLIRVMANVPRQPFVQIPKDEHGDGILSLVDVYKYCHSTILRFSETLPDHYVRPSKDTPSMIRPVSARTYNILLDYLLRHRMDVDAAWKLLRHMCARRDIQPTIVTYNIILRRATLLRRNDIAQQALELFRKMDNIADPLLLKLLECMPPQETQIQENPWKKKPKRKRRSRMDTGLVPAPPTESHGSPLPSRSSDGPRSIASQVDASAHSVTERQQPKNSYPPSAFGHALENLALAQFSLDGVNRDALQNMDAYTISSYIAYLTSTNQPDGVIKLLYLLFPETQPFPHAPRPIREALYGARTRGAILGPYFFSTILNALRKKGRTGLTERAWYLAQVSEEASWDLDPAVSGGVQPWCLDITAYTTMLECYANESRKGALASARNKMHVIGWGYFNWLSEGALESPATMHKLRRSRNEARSIAGRELGYLVSESMRARATLMWRAFERNRARDVPSAPKPDARFFNALLGIFGRTPHLRRRPRVKRCYFLKRYERALRRYNRQLLLPKPKDYDPVLATIADEMARHGFTMPIGLRVVTLGRNVRLGRPLPPPIRPHRFPVDRQAGFRPYKLHTSKDKGMPFPREPKRWKVTTNKMSDWGKKFERQRTANGRSNGYTVNYSSNAE